MKRSLLVTLALLLAVSAAKSQTNLPLLPNNAGYTLQSVNSGTSSTTRINTYTDQGKKTYQVNPVNCPGGLQNIGKLYFDYAPYTGDFNGGNGNTFGGAIINGGFILNAAKYNREIT